MRKSAPVKAPRLGAADASAARTVRARVHSGAPSLDLTVPAVFVRKLGLRPGDVWEVTAREENGAVVLSYVRVHSTE